MKENALALLTNDYVSPLLLNTLMREGIPAFVRGKRLKEELERFCPGLKLLGKEEALDIISKEDSRLLANAEDLLSCIADHSLDPSRSEGLRQLRDKRRFRELESESYPDYFFLEAKSSRLKEIELPPGRSYIIKPSSGLKGIGVRMAKESKDLHRMADALSQEVKEFACDAYLSPKGEPVVLGIYAHPLRDEEDFRDIVYYTSTGVIRKMLPRVSDFLRKLSAQTGLKGIPLHAEFRLQKNRLIPLEVNPLRFGSFSIPDLTFFAFRVNPYKCYYNWQKPEWKRILSQEGEEIFFRVLARLPEDVIGTKDLSVDHEKFADTFNDLIGYCKLDTKRYPAFSIAFGKTGNIDDVQKYLDLDYQEYLS